MRSFDEILAIAAERKGGVEPVLAAVHHPLPPDQLAAIPDDRWLAQMARQVFQSGFNWKVIEAKWPGFEAAFGGFAVAPLAFMPPEMFDALLADRRIVRHAQKIRSVHENALFVQQVAGEFGSFGRHVADWSHEDYVGLLAWLSKRGSRLGGNTGAYVLRFIGKEGFLLSRDVVARLVAEGVIDGPPTSQRALRAVQAAFDGWRKESGHSFNVISRVLAQSIG
jgi:3-methyladenine DNA glycosylase Tag